MDYTLLVHLFDCEAQSFSNAFLEEETMPRRKKDQAAEGENLMLPGTEGETPEAVAAPAPRGRKAAAENGNGHGHQRPTLDAGRRSAIDKALVDLTKRFGDGAVMRLGEAT